MEPAGKVALTDQKTAKTLGKILHQKAQWIAEKIGQKLLTTRKVVAEACQRCQIVKLKNGGSMNSIMSFGIGQFSKRKRTTRKAKAEQKKFLGRGRGDYAVFPQRVLRTSLAEKKGKSQSVRKRRIEKGLVPFTHSVQFTSVLYIYVVNKPPSAAGVSEDNAQG